MCCANSLKFVTMFLLWMIFTLADVQCWHENRFVSRTNGRIATKLAHDGLQVSVHRGCAQGQGQGE